ncbi:MAG: hypothetical protein ACJAV1_001152 [Paraglaciecola sp.]|jgi:hypothetical protein
MTLIPLKSVAKQSRDNSHTRPVSLNLRQANAFTLQQEISWFSQVMALRLDLYFQQTDIDPHLCDIYQLTMPDLAQDVSPYGEVITQYQLNFDERIVLILALIPHIKPHVLDMFFSRNTHLDRGYTEFGGKKGQHHSGFIPTAETAVFILGGEDIDKRLQISALFEQGHVFAQAGMLTLDHNTDGEPSLSRSLSVSHEYLNRLTTGTPHTLHYSSEFPATLITSPLSWQDLVLAPEVMDEIDKLKTWIQYSDVILHKWGLAKILKPGYRTLFYGPPGTGKTLTATLIGAELGLAVYRIDLSAMVSKYIGETEKNLANLFDQAQSKNWILFFDEADALFGTRSAGSSANDRHSNQQIAYLLQRIEDFPGVVILATNLRANIDDAFSRRFQSLIYFPMPDAEQRFTLWNKALNGHSELASQQDLQTIAGEYELAGGAISNVVRYAAISALQAKSDTISYYDLRKGIAKELRKEGRTL